MEKKNYKELLNYKQFLKLLVANNINRFGDALDMIVYSWIMYEITGSESLMALIIGINFIPTVLLQPFAGTLTDRSSKKKIMVLSDLLRAVFVCIFVYLYVKGILTPFVIGVLAVLTSTVEAFRLPASGAIMPLLIDEDCYTLAKGADYSSSRISLLLGLALSGVLVKVVGSSGVLLIDAFTFVISAILIQMIQVHEVVKDSIFDRKEYMQTLKEGFVYLKQHKAIQVISLVGLVINFGLMPLMVFQVPYVSTYLNMGIEVISLIKVLMIVGMMLGAFIAPKLVKYSKSSLTSITGISMGFNMILMYVLVSVSNTYLQLTLLVGTMLLVGVGGGILNVIVSGCMMLKVPSEMMGRMMAINIAIMASSMPIGSFVCARLVTLLNVPQLLGLFGLLTMLFYILFWLKKSFVLLNE